MKNQNFAATLRRYRQLNNLSVSEVASYLSKEVKPISEKSVYSWEVGNSKPTSDMFMAVCELYHIQHVLETFGYHTDTTDIEYQETTQKDSDNLDNSENYGNLSQEEINLIKAYREHPEFKDAVKKLYS